MDALREIYGTHKCDVESRSPPRSAIPTARRSMTASAMRMATEVDNIEDVDTVVGWLAETTRPHGFAISETQFQLFILNASRRLFSDRFFTSSFRPEFYTTFGLDWVNEQRPGRQADGARRAERSRAGGRSTQAHTAA